MAKLNTHVVVHDPNGSSVTLGPDDTIPEWAERAITNPNVWDGDAPAFETEEDAGSEDEPARSGRGSGLGFWVSYATSLGIEVPDGAKRDDVIKLVEEKKAEQA